MDDELIRIERRDAPGGEPPQEAQRNRVTVLASDLNQVGIGVATTAVAYGAKKVVDKFRKPPPGPGPGGGQGGGGDPGPEAGRLAGPRS
jgi:ABC-type transport system substrate-binding protein